MNLLSCWAAVLLAAPAAGPEGSVVAAWRGDLRATVELEGTLIPADSVPIALWLDEYRGELLVLEVAPHGAFVNEGDTLITFETRRIDEQLRQAEFDLVGAEARLAATEEEHRLAEAAEQNDLARAEKEADWAARQLAGYLDKERAFKLESIRLRDQGTQHNLEDQRDELEQLEKMYREDELVDATEEIVLKRARRRLARSIASAKLSRDRNEHDLALAEAIKQERLELEAARKRDALERKGRSVALARAKRQRDLERARFDLDKDREHLARLQHDRSLLAVRAPRGGLVLHGDPEAAPGNGQLERGGRVGLFKTVMAVADPDRLAVLTDVPESSLVDVRKGLVGEITTEAAPDYSGLGRIDVAYLPTGRKGEENLYRAEVALEKRDPRLRPGMRCTISIVVSEERDVVLIPRQAVRRDGGRTVVRCAAEGGAFEERLVVLGPSDGRNVVVREGVAPGEVVELAGGTR